MNGGEQVGGQSRQSTADPDRGVVSVSFVVVARNDDYGGDFLGRMQRFVDRLLGLAAEQSAKVELVVVEWNPPAERPRIREVLRWPSSAETIPVRIVHVPASVHERYPNASTMPVFEYIAKNVGIRRAAGDFIVATNPDLLYPPRLLQAIRSDRLDRSCFYRVNRLDVVDDGTFQNVRTAHTRFGALSTGFPYVTPGNLRRLAGFAKQWALLFPHWPPHTVASGDFLMMHRDAWHGLRGYPELPTHSFIDGYMCYAAKSSGLREVVARGGLHHIDHAREEQASRPLSDIVAYRARCREMLTTRTPWVPNNSTWGLVGELLEETRVP